MGKRGQAVVVGDRPDGYLWIAFGTTGSIRLREGSVALWIQPRGWKGTDEGFRCFFMIRDASLCKFHVKAKKAHTAVDEFVIFSRALSADEIAADRDRDGRP
jgi:hypothetical protein